MLTFVQNQIDSLPNHRATIKELLHGTKRLYLSVAYIRNTGLDIIIDDIRQIIKNGGIVRVICSDEMGITQSSAIKRLLDIGVTVKVCRLQVGTFHAKLWLLQHDEGWHCIVGSANLSRSAFENNVEASLAVDQASNIGGFIEQALLFFEYLWNQSVIITYDSLSTWKERETSQSEVKDKIEKTKTEPTASSMSNVLWAYTRSWIDIAKSKKQKDNYSETLWRGWYIIPDHDLINDSTMKHLQRVLIAIRDNLEDGYFDISSGSSSLPHIFHITQQKFKRPVLKTPLRELFIRQEKNYLVKFGLLYHPIKKNGVEDSNRLMLTSSGREYADCTNIESMKKIYSDNMIHYTWGNTNIYEFTTRLLFELSYIDFYEFSLFVMHSYSNNERQNILDIISIYRKFNEVRKQDFYHGVTSYFEEVKGKTAKNVVGNYYKHAKYNMSAIGWTEGLKWNQDDNKIILINKNAVIDLFDRNDIVL